MLPRPRDRHLSRLDRKGKSGKLVLVRKDFVTQRMFRFVGECRGFRFCREVTLSSPSQRSGVALPVDREPCMTSNPCRGRSTALDCGRTLDYELRSFVPDSVVREGVISCRCSIFGAPSAVISSRSWFGAEKLRPVLSVNPPLWRSSSVLPPGMWLAEAGVHCR